MIRNIVSLSFAALVFIAIAGSAGAAPATGSNVRTGSLAAKAMNCTTIMVTKWKCPPGQSPSGFMTEGNRCTIVMVPETVCKQ